MSNKKRISRRIRVLEKKHFLKKHQVRIFKRGMLALERTKSGEIF